MGRSLPDGFEASLRITCDASKTQSKLVTQNLSQPPSNHCSVPLTRSVDVFGLGLDRAAGQRCCEIAVDKFHQQAQRANRNVWSAASPQAKCEDVTSWSAQMYTAFVGVNHSWPGWNALRSFPH